MSLSPMYLQSDERATGLVRLLSIGLRMLTSIEYCARQHLADLNEKLPGLYAGNPKRTTDHPTAEAMLRAFKGIYLSAVTIGEQVLYHVSPVIPCSSENSIAFRFLSGHLRSTNQRISKTCRKYDRTTSNSIAVLRSRVNLFEHGLAGSKTWVAYQAGAQISYGTGCVAKRIIG